MSSCYAWRVLIARSSPECHLYIELHPCACGERAGLDTHRLESGTDGLVAVYEGTCPGCRTHRRFDFALDPELPPGGKFGGRSLSQVIDAGQYLAVADAAARSVPADTSQLDTDARAHARATLARAIAALEEVVKFIPAGADRVPPDALFTPAGRAVYDAEPGRFRKLRLDAVLGAYRELLAKM
jgi:hypothetical protein